MSISQYGKALAAALMLVVAAVQAALSDSDTAGRISQVEGVQIAIAAVTAVAVWLAPNLPGYPWIKTATAALLAALQLGVTLIVDGISSADWSALILAALTVVSVGASSSRSEIPVGQPTAGHREIPLSYDDRSEI